MKRVLVAAALGGALLAAAGCGSKSETPTGNASATSASPSQSVDLAADTKKVCGTVEELIDKGMDEFGIDLGSMLVYLDAGDKGQAAAARAEAQNELKKLAEQIRATTAAALDPELKESGEKAAKNVEATAADSEFFDSLKTIDDLDALEPEVVTWLVPLSEHCA